MVLFLFVSLYIYVRNAMGDFNPAEADKVLQQMRQQVTVQALTNLINVRNHVCVAREREREREVWVYKRKRH